MLSARVREQYKVHTQHPASGELSLSLSCYISLVSLIDGPVSSHVAHCSTPITEFHARYGAQPYDIIRCLCTCRDSRGIFRQPWDFADPVAFIQDGYLAIPILAQMALPCRATWNTGSQDPTLLKVTGKEMK